MASSPPNAVVTEGFEKRILWKTASAGAMRFSIHIVYIICMIWYGMMRIGTAGAALGAFLALGKKTKVLPASLTGAASLGMLSLAFTGMYLLSHPESV
jgi:hypothetical protein